MERLRAAIMGCGRISSCYEDAFRRLSDYVELVCAIDIDKDKAEAFGKKFNCHYSTDLESALQYRIDVIHLCLPHYLHSVMAVKASWLVKDILERFYLPGLISPGTVRPLITKAATGKEPGIWREEAS